MPNNIKFNSGFVGCDDKCAIMRHELVPRRLKDNQRFEEISAEDITNGMYVYVDNNGEDCKANLSDVIWPDQVQSDWEEPNPEKAAYIRNKPVIADTFVKETFNSTAKVGGVEVGELILKGTPWADVVRRILAGITGEAYLYWGIVDTDPYLDSEDVPHVDWTVEQLANSAGGGYTTISRAELLNNGFEWPGVVYTLDNARQVIAFNKDAQLDVDWMEQEGMFLSRYEGLERAEKDGYYFFYLANRSTGRFRCKYHFVDSAIDITGGLYFGTSHKKPLEVHDLDPLDYRNKSRSELLNVGFDWEADILTDDSEGWPPYAYWFTILGSEGSEGPDIPLDGWNILAINKNLHLECYGVKQVTTAQVEDQEFMHERIGEWDFYFFQQKTRGHFHWHYIFKEVR